MQDQQGNVNLEGVGFVDEEHGWVGGWGSADFTAVTASEVTDFPEPDSPTTPRTSFSARSYDKPSTASTGPSSVGN